MVGQKIHSKTAQTTIEYLILTGIIIGSALLFMNSSNGLTGKLTKTLQGGTEAQTSKSEEFFSSQDVNVPPPGTKVERSDPVTQAYTTMPPDRIHPLPPPRDEPSPSPTGSNPPLSGEDFASFGPGLSGEDFASIGGFSPGSGGSFGDLGPSIIPQELDFAQNNLNLPACSHPNALIIKSPAELSKVNNAGNASVVCFSGNFSNSTLTLSSGGSASNPLILRFNGTKFKDLKFVGKAGNIILDGIHVDKQGLKSQTIIHGNNITFNNSLIERGSDVMLKIFGSNVTVQGSVLRDTFPVPFRDVNCVSVFPGANNLKFIDNKFKDCAGDGIQILPGVWETLGRSSPNNVIIAGNEIYITSRLRQANGTACAENGIDLKAGDNIFLKNNKIYGYRKSDPTCGTSGSWGSAIAIHRVTYRVTLDSNVMFDVPDPPGSDTCINVVESGSSRSGQIHLPKIITFVGVNYCQMHNDSGDHTGKYAAPLFYP